MVKTILPLGFMGLTLVLSACGGGGTEDPLSTLSFGKVSTSEPSINEKLEDAIDLAYIFEDEDQIDFLIGINYRHRISRLKATYWSI